jgi:phage-related protein
MPSCCFPEEVRRQVGGALWDAQLGRKAPFAKPLKGFIQKKSKHGIATPRVDLDLIERRLKRAREDYDQWSRSANLRSR